MVCRAAMMALVAAAAVACSPAAADSPGNGNGDGNGNANGGELGPDAATAGSSEDAGGDSEPQELEVSCDTTYEWTVHGDNGAEQRRHRVYALISLADKWEAADIVVRRCGEGYANPYGCGEAATCSGSVPDLPCNVQRGGDVADGSLMILCSDLVEFWNDGELINVIEAEWEVSAVASP